MIENIKEEVKAQSLSTMNSSLVYKNVSFIQSSNQDWIN